MDLPDVNVWLAMTMPAHPQHEPAQRYWSDVSHPDVAFSRVTALGLLRLLTNAAAMAGRPLTLEDAWQAYSRLRDLAEVTLCAEPGGCEATLRAWVEQGIFTPRLWTDAYLAAFAAAGNLRLVSFDSDFERFPGLNFLRLQP